MVYVANQAQFRADLSARELEWVYRPALKNTSTDSHDWPTPGLGNTPLEDLGKLVLPEGSIGFLKHEREDHTSLPP